MPRFECGCGRTFPNRQALVDHMTREHVRRQK